MVEVKVNKRVMRKDNNPDEPMYVEIPSVVVEGYGLRDGDEVEWTYFINCKNQKKVTLKYEYKGY
ncbi:MAG: hypothetical protein BZ138_00385 [Methanosphaera sp. rholeuAM270]|nr:MAG: hypothetical protein BZ138_00385 [Methanosphaera sp. rholeuAM270]